MMTAFKVLLNSTNTALVLFVSGAALASIVTTSALTRIGAGITATGVALLVTIDSRSLFGWGVSAIERPSVPGFVLLTVLAIATVRGWRLGSSAEFRFATAAAAVAGIVLYPSAMGFIDYDTYGWGFGGYLLPSAIAALIGYAIYQGYFITALALNVAIAIFLTGLGTSQNLWDSVIDTIAAIIGIGTWIILLVHALFFRRDPAKARESAQPSSGIGDTPISH